MKKLYEKKGQVQMNISYMWLLVMGVAIATLVLIFTSVMSAQVYTQVETDIQAINDTTIKGYVTNAIQSGFKAYETTGNYMPILVLAIIIAVVLKLVFSIGNAGSYSYGGAL